MKVYQIVQLTTRSAGHGSSEDIAIVVSQSAYSVRPHPLFKTKEAAEEHCRHFISSGVHATVIELTIE
jgi:hypothetical protein